MNNSEYKRGILAALAIVKSHKPGGVHRFKMGDLHPQVRESIRDEERGEQIAKEEIAKNIENLLESIPP